MTCCSSCRVAVHSIFAAFFFLASMVLFVGAGLIAQDTVRHGQMVHDYNEVVEAWNGWGANSYSQVKATTIALNKVTLDKPVPTPVTATGNTDGVRATFVESLVFTGKASGSTVKVSSDKTNEVFTVYVPSIIKEKSFELYCGAVGSTAMCTNPKEMCPAGFTSKYQGSSECYGGDVPCGMCIGYRYTSEVCVAVAGGETPSWSMDYRYAGCGYPFTAYKYEGLVEGAPFNVTVMWAADPYYALAVATKGTDKFNATYPKDGIIAGLSAVLLLIAGCCCCKTAHRRARPPTGDQYIVFAPTPSSRAADYGAAVAALNGLPPPPLNSYPAPYDKPTMGVPI